MDYEQVTLERLDGAAEGVALATLRRPEKMNAVGGRLVHELLDVVESTRHDDSVKVLVITGEGRGFCAGADVGEDEQARAEGKAFVESAYRRHTTAPIGHWGSLFSAIKAYPKPTIAAVNGAAAGAGMSLALVCDIRIASSNARFVSAFVHRAISPDTGSTYHLPRLIGTGRALEMMFTGESVGASQAAEWGIVNRVVDPEQLLAESLGLAERIARGPSLAVELTKRLVQQSADIDFDGQLEREAWALSISSNSEDREEGIRSFLEKREPQFRGR